MQRFSSIEKNNFQTAHSTNYSTQIACKPIPTSPKETVWSQRNLAEDSLFQRNRLKASWAQFHLKQLWLKPSDLKIRLKCQRSTLILNKALTRKVNSLSRSQIKSEDLQMQRGNELRFYNGLQANLPNVCPGRRLYLHLPRLLTVQLCFKRCSKTKAGSVYDRDKGTTLQIWDCCPQKVCLQD